MNLKSKSIIASLALLAVISTPVLAITQNGNGSATTNEYDSTLGNHEVGVSKAYAKPSTHGFSWVNPDDNSKNCYTRVIIGGVTFNKAYGVGYAQASQEYRPGDVSVSEEHGGY